jgi:hypothetical protein
MLPDALDAAGVAATGELPMYCTGDEYLRVVKMSSSYSGGDRGA